MRGATFQIPVCIRLLRCSPQIMRDWPFVKRTEIGQGSPFWQVSAPCSRFVAGLSRLSVYLFHDHDHGRDEFCDLDKCLADGCCVHLVFGLFIVKVLRLFYLCLLSLVLSFVIISLIRLCDTSGTVISGRVKNAGKRRFLDTESG